MSGKTTVTIKELHAHTGELVRKAGKSRTPFRVTDHGRLVAVIGSPELEKTASRKRILLPEYTALLKKAQKGSVLADLDAARGDR